MRSSLPAASQKAIIAIPLDAQIASDFKSNPLAIEIIAVRITAISVAVSTLSSTDLEAILVVMSLALCDFRSL